MEIVTEETAGVESITVVPKRRGRPKKSKLVIPADSLPTQIPRDRVSEYLAYRLEAEKAHYQAEVAVDRANKLKAAFDECAEAIDRDFHTGKDDEFNADLLSPQCGVITRKAT